MLAGTEPERESERETDEQKGSEREGEEGLITVYTNESINKIIKLLAVVEPEATAGTGNGTTAAADAAEGTSEKREPEEEVVLAVAVENIDADAGNYLEGWSLVEGEGFHKASSGVGRETPCYSWSEWCHRSQAENQRWDTASPNVVDAAVVVVVGTVRGKGAEQVWGRSYERGLVSRRQQGVAQVGETKRSETLQLNAADC